MLCGTSVAYIPFNPIITDKGLPVVWKGENSGIVGWLDVFFTVGQEIKRTNRVMAIKLFADNSIIFVHPANPNVPLPKGLYLWQSGWDFWKGGKKPHQVDGLILKAGFEQSEQNNYFKNLYCSGSTGQGVGNSLFRFADTTMKVWTSTKDNKVWVATDARHDYPSLEVENIFKWDKRDKDAAELPVPENRFFRQGLFYGIMGVTEEYFRELSRDQFGKVRLPHTMFPLPWEVENQELEKYFPGRSLVPRPETFKILKLQDLYTQAKELLQKTPDGKGKLSIINGYELFEQMNARQATDIRFLQSQSENVDAVFQLASNFNDLEGGVGDPTHLVESMMYRPAQGEEACLATLGAAILRKYWINEIKPINILQDLPHVEVNAVGRIIKITQKLTEADIPKIAVGLQQDVPVSSGYFRGFSGRYPGYENIEDSSVKDRVTFLYKSGAVVSGRDPLNIFNSVVAPQNINQVFTAALDVNMKNKGAINDPQSAQILLKAAYQGTLLAAAVSGKKKLFLTLVGAGAFKNELEWINNALESNFTVDGRMITLAEIIARAGLEVIIVIHSDPRPDRVQDIIKRKDFIKRLVALNDTVQAFNQKPNFADTLGTQPLLTLFNDLSVLSALM
jgi:hypothetical protein